MIGLAPLSPLPPLSLLLLFFFTSTFLFHFLVLPCPFSFCSRCSHGMKLYFNSIYVSVLAWIWESNNSTCVWRVNFSLLKGCHIWESCQRNTDFLLQSLRISYTELQMLLHDGSMCKNESKHCSIYDENNKKFRSWRLKLSVSVKMCLKLSPILVANLKVAKNWPIVVDYYSIAKRIMKNNVIVLVLIWDFDDHFHVIDTFEIRYPLYPWYPLTKLKKKNWLSRHSSLEPLSTTRNIDAARSSPDLIPTSSFSTLLHPYYCCNCVQPFIRWLHR